MGLESLPLYNSEGRLRGSYIYMLLCRDFDGPVYVKVGITDKPGNRLQTLRGGCPVTPRRFCIVEVRSRDKAKKLEKMLHESMDKWRQHGEWFLVSMSDKPAFNEAWKDVFAKETEKSWPLQWTQIPVEGLQQYSDCRRRYWHKLYYRRGKAYQDFKKHSP